MIYFKPLSFTNYQEVLNLSVQDSQKAFVECPAETIALAYAGLMEGHNGKLLVIYHDKTPIGLVLTGKSPIAPQEPAELQNYPQAYRIMGFLIDQRYQNQGLGKAAFSQLMTSIHRENLQQLPITLEVKEKNTPAQMLYQALGFVDTHVKYDDDLVYLYAYPTAK